MSTMDQSLCSSKIQMEDYRLVPFLTLTISFLLLSPLLSLSLSLSPSLSLPLSLSFSLSLSLSKSLSPHNLKFYVESTGEEK